MEGVHHLVEKSTNLVCEYGSYGEYLAMAHRTSLFMGWILLGVGMVYKSIELAFVSKVLLISQFPVWILQIVFLEIREDFWCHGKMIYTFPSMEIFYIWTLGWSFLAFSWTWGWKISVFRWALLISWLGIPMGILIWVDHLRWWEALVSVGLGIVVSSFSTFKFKEDICPVLPDILSEPLIVWFGYKDASGCLTTKQTKRLEELTLLKSRTWHGQRSRRYCGLYSGC